MKGERSERAMRGPENLAAERDIEHAERQAWIRKVRSLHRNTRMIGFAGIMAGAGVLLWWKYTPDAPQWAMWAGGSLLLLSWAVFIFVILDRYRWVKKHPFRPSGS